MRRFIQSAACPLRLVRRCAYSCSLSDAGMIFGYRNDRTRLAFPLRRHLPRSALTRMHAGDCEAAILHGQPTRFSTGVRECKIHPQCNARLSRLSLPAPRFLVHAHLAFGALLKANSASRSSLHSSDRYTHTSTTTCNLSAPSKHRNLGHQVLPRQHRRYRHNCHKAPACVLVHTFIRA